MAQTLSVLEANEHLYLADLGDQPCSFNHSWMTDGYWGHGGLPSLDHIHPRRSTLWTVAARNPIPRRIKCVWQHERSLDQFGFETRLFDANIDRKRRDLKR